MSTVEVAPGDGWLACRSGALLWCPDPSRPDALLAAFVDAPDAESTRAAVTDAVVGAALDVPAFALVTWMGDLHVVVMGAVDVETDAPSLPLLSGATSRTWVEHGVVGTAPVEVVAGGRPGAGTDVGDGVVRAGGFRLTATPGWVAAPVAPVVAEPATPVDPDPHVVPEPAPEPAPSGRSALLDIVTGGDWMEDSIGLGAPGALLAAAADVEPQEEPAPRFPEGTVTVLARTCPAGHPNPPTSATCQQCGDLVDLAAPLVEVAQPILALLMADDGVSIPVTGQIIVGRRPDPAAAGLEDEAEQLVLPERPGVSRTHLVVRADGWTITATDCGSRRGTELVRPGAAPVRLEPWTSHEVQTGDELLLGGPAAIRLVKPAPGESSPSSP